MPYRLLVFCLTFLCFGQILWEMGKKRQLKDNVEIKLIVEKNLQLIDAMKKLNELLDQDAILKPRSDKNPD